ncbi:MAG: hypothetical protein M3317_11265, partial [Actinomycetota bacterium]|nr:hypothetical protein [Actinomycetota bacterium]
PAHLGNSVAAAVPQKPVRACQLAGCDRPVIRHNRRYCSRHHSLAAVDYVEHLWERPAVKGAYEAAWQLHDLERAAAPVRRMEAVRRLVEPVEFSYSLPTAFPSIDSSIKLARQQEALIKGLELTVAPLRSLLSVLPTPPRLPLFQREAKEAWLSFHQGDPEPLDSFIRKHLVRLKRHEGPVPDEIRKRVMGVLDECFAPMLVYAPGDWYFFGPAAQEKLVDFAGKTRNKFGSVSYDARVEDKLPGAILTAWDDIQWDTDASTRTLLNRIDIYLRGEGDQGPKWLEIAEKRPHAFPDEDAENPLARFEAREAVRQQVEALPRLIERGVISRRERLVYEFDSRVGSDFETIEEAGEAAAGALNVSRTTVRTLRFRYRKELRQAIASDPWFQKIFKEIAPDL